ncbi:MAG: hypothetical protein HYV14_13510 [Elusimicrobia bacterium]|nr:hypothetical protein [Elusimicrobiota bacterium]
MTVFEASNDTLKEFYLFISTQSLGTVVRAHCDRPPKKIAHWRKGQAIFYNEVEVLPDEAQAWEFLEKYVGTLERTGWKVLV